MRLVSRVSIIGAVVVLAALLTACQPEGSVDVAQDGNGVLHVAGWARDPDTTQPIQVHVYVDGKLVTTGEANGYRPDVEAAKAASAKPAGANHGFDITVPVPAQAGTVCVYGIDAVGGDANNLIGCRTLGLCVVALHGLGGSGRATETGLDGIRYVYPSGNGGGPGGRSWAYGDEGSYQAARAIVQQAIDANGCGRVVVDGFSNGGGFAGKLLCRGESFGGRVAGYILDDPVTDRSADAGCDRAPGVAATMYWTGGLDFAGAGFNCAASGWTCEGGTLVGRDEYAARLGVAVQHSIWWNHQPYAWPPEVGQWL